jgi:hypothetical protein
MASISRAVGSRVRLAEVSSTWRRSRVNSATPRAASSALVCWERDGAAICRRAAEVRFLGDSHEVAQLA